MVREEFQSRAQFETRDGYKIPIYPKNQDVELRQHILDRAAQLSGCYIAMMTADDVWYTNAAAQIQHDEKQNSLTTPTYAITEPA
jgi:hypothetical protein